MLSTTWIAAAGLWAVAAGAGFGWGVPASEPAPEPVTAVEPAPPAPEAWETFTPPVDAQDRFPDPPWAPPLPDPEPWTVSAWASPRSTSEQGVGTIITVHFSEYVPVRARWKIADNLTVTSTDGEQDLSAPWVWLDSETAAYRPKDFWRPHQTVTVKSTWSKGEPLMLLAKKPGKKKVGVDDYYGFTVTDKIRLKVQIGADQQFLLDADTHQGKVVRDGKTVREVPVSLGMTGWETYGGVKTIMERYETKRLYNPGQWDVTVPYALRLTLSGEFLHSAPWNSVIGSDNISHGCTNVTVEDAQWFYENIQTGDPVITENGKGVPPLWDGDGAGWNVPWTQWKAMAAVAP